jgi:NitT/TauT family transport system substrate-binding protein
LLGGTSQKFPTFEGKINKMKIRIYIFFMLAPLFLVALQAQELVEVRYLPHWMHQAQFAGYYMAKEKGIYEKYGLNVVILPGGPNAPAIESLVAGETDITSGFLSGAIKAEARGLDVVNIGQVSQRSALMYIARRSDSIFEPQDFNNKKIGIWRSDFKELPVAFLEKYDIEAEIIPITSTVNLFLKGGIDVMCVMWYNEYHQVINHGINEDELITFNFYDHDLDFPEDAILTQQSYFQENTMICRKFVQATFEGWAYAFENKNEAIDVVLKYMKAYKIPANRSHQTWMLSRMQDILLADSSVMTGELKHDDYIKTAGVLLESGAIEKIPVFQKFNKTPLQK